MPREPLALLLLAGCLGCESHELPRAAVLLEIPVAEGAMPPRAASAGDVDRDGVQDVIVGSTQSRRGEVLAAATVHSAKTGRVLLRLETNDVQADQVLEVASAGDTDGDGFPDLLLGDPEERGASAHGRAWLFSGRDGKQLASWNGDETSYGFGASLTGLGDLDGDGAAEFAIGASQRRRSYAGDGASQVHGPGWLRVHSGKSREPLFTARGAQPGRDFGDSPCTIGDVDRDGRADLAVGCFWTSDRAVLTLVSGLDGRSLRELELPESGDGGAVSVARLDDRNGDGLPEIGVEHRGRALVVSGDGSAVLLDLDCGDSPAWIGDFDGDGHVDFVTCGPASRPAWIDEHFGLESKLWSGRDGRELGLAFFLPFSPPSAVRSLGDVDGDRVPDLLLSHAGVRVVSGGKFFRLR